MQGAGSPLTDWINADVKTANTISIIMIIFAAWAGIEAITNVAGVEIPPETGMATNVDPDDTQRTNNGVIVGLGAVLGTVGVIIQVLIPRGETEEEIEDKGPVFDEDLVKLTKWLCSRGTTTAEFFEWADVDGSGSIDMVELANALRAAEIANLPPWEIEDLVKVMDINSDGRINLPELDITLLNIRNTLGIEFIPYVEEEPEPEVVEEEASESEETEEVAEIDAEEEAESEEAQEADEETSVSEEADDTEEADAKEVDESEISETTDSEETSDETDAKEEASESEDADDADETDAEEESEEASESDDAEVTVEESEAVEEAEEETDAGEEEETESEEASESDDAEATEEESEAVEETEEETDAGEEEETESEEASESDDAEATEEESEAVEETEDEGTDDAEVEVEEEIPKKKKKF